MVTDVRSYMRAKLSDRGFVRGGPDNPGVVADDILRCVHPMCLKYRVVAESMLRCDANHRSWLQIRYQRPSKRLRIFDFY